DTVEAAVLTFFAGRLENILRDRGFAYDTVAAVLAVQASSPRDAVLRCEALQAFRDSDEAMADLTVAFGRASNLSDVEAGTEVVRDAFTAYDADLDAALSDAEARAGQLLEAGDYAGLLQAFSTLRAPIDAFFENVMVMDE